MRIALAFAAAAVVLLAACSNKHTIYTKNGTATVETQNGGQTTTYQSKEGKVTIGKGAVDTSKLGAPVYPGAGQGSDAVAMNVNSKTGSGQMATFTTTDSFDKVYAWYKQQLPKGAEKMKLDSGGSSIAEFVMGEEKTGQTMVMLSAKDGKTQITITHGTNSGNNG